MMYSLCGGIGSCIDSYASRFEVLSSVFVWAWLGLILTSLRMGGPLLGTGREGLIFFCFETFGMFFFVYSVLFFRKISSSFLTLRLQSFRDWRALTSQSVDAIICLTRCPKKFTIRLVIDEAVLRSLSPKIDELLFLVIVLSLFLVNYFPSQEFFASLAIIDLRSTL